MEKISEPKQFGIFFFFKGKVFFHPKDQILKALVLSAPNKIEIVEKEKPKVGKGEALVKIKAASLNHRDQWCREGKYPGIEYGTILGSDGSGIVEEVGDSSDKEWLNKKVIINPNISWGANPAVQSAQYNILGMPQDGTFAEYVLVKTDRLHLKPEYLSFSSASAFPLGGLTAYRSVFTHGKIKSTDKVLISGVGGGVAQSAFLFCVAVGASVYVTSSKPENFEQTKKLGAKGGFNYKDSDWVNAARQIGGFDLIIDSAGGDSFNDLINLAKPGGKVVFYGATNGLPKNLNLHKIFWNQLTLQGSTMGNDEEFVEMLSFIAQHEIEPIIDSVRPFDQIITAFDEMKGGKQSGKLVVEIV